MTTDLLRDGTTPAPPPSGALLAAVADMKAVRTRVPARTLGAMVVVASLMPLGLLIGAGLRKDLPALPAGWVLSIGLAWAAVASLCLAAALLPPRGDVLASAARAGRAAWLAPIVMLLLAVLATVDAPGATIIPQAAFGSATWHCLRTSLQICAPVALVATLLLRGAVPAGGLRIAAALGAGGGALAGLTLHFICPFGGSLHVGIAHVGGMIAGTLLSALLLPRFLRA